MTSKELQQGDAVVGIGTTMEVVDQARMIQPTVDVMQVGVLIDVEADSANPTSSTSASSRCRAIQGFRPFSLDDRLDQGDDQVFLLVLRSRSSRTTAKSTRFCHSHLGRELSVLDDTPGNIL